MSRRKKRFRRFWAGIGPSPVGVGADAAAPTYTISGTLTDSAAAALSGKTVTLSGDASDTAVTDGSGNYSFTGLANGSYTVTPPAEAGKEWNPTSTNVTISDANQTGKNFQRFLDLPYTYDISTEVSQSSGLLAGQNSDWTVVSGFADATIYTTGLADSNSFTPSGVTKQVTWEWGASRSYVINDLPDFIDDSRTSLRFAVLQYENVRNDRLLNPGIINVTAAEVNAGTPAITGTMYFSMDINADTDEVTCQSRYGAETEYNEYSATDMGANAVTNRYHWVRVEYDFAGETVDIAVVRAEDDSVIWSDSQTMNAAGVSLGRVPTGMKAFLLLCAQSTQQIRVVKYWIGGGSDAWPSVAP